MGYLVAARFHDQPVDLPRLAVGRTDDQFAAYPTAGSIGGGARVTAGLTLPNGQVNRSATVLQQVTVRWPVRGSVPGRQALGALSELGHFRDQAQPLA